MQTVLAGTFNHAVQFRKVKPVLFGLDVFPCHAAQQRVDVRVDHLLPDSVHVLGGGERGVLQLAPSYEKGLSLDDELLRPFRVDEVRCVQIVVRHVGDVVEIWDIGGGCWICKSGLPMTRHGLVDKSNEEPRAI